MAAKLKATLGYDDSLDAFGVHRPGWDVGGAANGNFRGERGQPDFKGCPREVLASGLLEGNSHQLLNQLAGVAIAWALGIVGTLAILKLVHVTIGLRIAEEEEVQGLDLSQHGEEGYYWEASA
jgi:ammonium transporter, Amt family